MKMFTKVTNLLVWVSVALLCSAVVVSGRDTTRGNHDDAFEEYHQRLDEYRQSLDKAHRSLNEAHQRTLLSLADMQQDLANQLANAFRAAQENILLALQQANNDVADGIFHAFQATPPTPRPTPIWELDTKTPIKKPTRAPKTPKNRRRSF